MKQMIFISVVWLSCCGGASDPSTPEGAFAMVAPCMDGRDSACLYRRLDRESRWAIQTIHKTLVAIRGRVDTSYPEARRAEAFGAFEAEARTETPADMFAVYCEKRRCFEGMAEGFGAVKRVLPTGADRAVVETVRSGRFEMARYDGEWGLARFQHALLAAKLRFMDSLALIEENARAFDEQRAATETAEK